MIPLFSYFVQTAHAAHVALPTGINPGGGPVGPASVDPTPIINGFYSSAFNILTLVAGAAAILYILWAGIQYITSAGSPEKAKAARGAIINGVIGIVIVVAAYWIIQIGIYVGNEFTKTSGAINLHPLIQVAHAAGNISPEGTVTPGTTNAGKVIETLYNSAFNIITLIAGGLAVLYILWAGIQYITSAGSPEKAKTARTAIINGVIGVVIVVAAYWIIQIGIYVGNEFTKTSGTQGTALPEKTDTGKTTTAKTPADLKPGGGAYTATKEEPMTPTHDGVITHADGTTSAFKAGDGLMLVKGDKVTFNKGDSATSNKNDTTTPSLPLPAAGTTSQTAEEYAAHRARCAALLKGTQAQIEQYTRDCKDALDNPTYVPPKEPTKPSISILAYDPTTQTYIGGAQIVIGGTSFKSSPTPNTQPITLSGDGPYQLNFSDPSNRYGNCIATINFGYNSVAVIQRSPTTNATVDTCDVQVEAGN